MSSTEEKLDKLLEIMLAGNNPTPVQAIAPVVVNERQRAEIGGWFVMKAIGGVVLAVFTSLVTLGLIWVIQTVNETANVVTANEQQRVSDRKLDNQKIDTLRRDVSEVKENTNDRFTSKDADAKINPVVDAVSRNAAQIEVLSTTLVNRTDFMTNTKTDIALLKRELGIKEETGK